MNKSCAAVRSSTAFPPWDTQYAGSRAPEGAGRPGGAGSETALYQAKSPNETLAVGADGGSAIWFSSQRSWRMKPWRGPRGHRDYLRGSGPPPDVVRRRAYPQGRTQAALPRRGGRLLRAGGAPRLSLVAVSCVWRPKRISWRCVWHTADFVRKTTILTSKKLKIGCPGCEGPSSEPPSPEPPE